MTTFNRTYKRKAMTFRKLQDISDTYLVSLDGSHREIISRFERFYLEGLTYSPRSKWKKIVQFGGEAVLSHVKHLLNEVGDLSIYMSEKARQQFIQDHIYTYVKEPHHIDLYSKIKGISDDLKSLRVRDTAIKKVLDLFAWEPSDSTLDSVLFFKRCDNKQTKKESSNIYFITEN